MIVEGTMQNRIIVLDHGATLPEGTRVRVIAEPPVQAGSAKELLMQMAGCMTDLAKNHDHYLHGTKEWSLTDCISFVVMKKGGITEVLTGDHHFEQAGFVALLN